VLPKNVATEIVELLSEGHGYRHVKVFGGKEIVLDGPIYLYLWITTCTPFLLWRCRNTCYWWVWFIASSAHHDRYPVFRSLVKTPWCGSSGFVLEKHLCYRAVPTHSEWHHFIPYSWQCPHPLFRWWHILCPEGYTLDCTWCTDTPLVSRRMCRWLPLIRPQT